MPRPESVISDLRTTAVAAVTIAAALFGVAGFVAGYLVRWLWR